MELPQNQQSPIFREARRGLCMHLGGQDTLCSPGCWFYTLRALWAPSSSPKCSAQVLNSSPCSNQLQPW